MTLRSTLLIILLSLLLTSSSTPTSANKLQDVYYCTVSFYLDEPFIREMGHGSKAVAINLLKGVMKTTNDIYWDTIFATDVVVQFQLKLIAEIKLRGYVYDSHKSNADHFLNLFQEQYKGENCAQVIWTFQDFGVIVGYATRGTTSAGLSTKTNHALISPRLYGKQIMQDKLAVVLAHELGHLMGAGHDKDQEDGHPCAPTVTGGRFVMSETVHGLDKANNRRFSECSKNAMSSILSAKLPSLKRNYEPFCGNGIIEKGEECDCGSESVCESIDPCCTPPTSARGGLGCALKLGAKCSPMAQPCCTEACAPTKRHQVCSASHECMQEAICTLETAECPQPEMKHNGALCSSRTKICKAGRCENSVCSNYNKEVCSCNQSEDYCYLCCKTSNSTCDILLDEYGKTRIQLPPGAICGHDKGICDNTGRCIYINTTVDTRRVKDEVVDVLSTNWNFLAILTFTALFGLLSPSLSQKQDIALQTLAYVSGRMSRAYFRLQYLFPTASLNQLSRHMYYASGERHAVILLILSGYPMRRWWLELLDNLNRKIPRRRGRSVPIEFTDVKCNK